MVILRMTASFGKLQKEELELREGLNILTLPNESGKSTWSAFLLAMFYGVDSAERAKAGTLPVKTKYKPWAGGQMEGRIDLLHEGRYISIERRSAGRVPMGEFRAYDTLTGEPIPALTAENCGQVLLGVSRSVFERSAFVRQGGISVSADADLERRLTALTSGEEGVSARDTAKRLREEKNRVQHNKTGLLPQAERELQVVEDQLSDIHAAHRADLELKNREQTLLARQKELETAQKALLAIDAAQKLQKKETAQAQLKAAEEELEAARAQTLGLPEAEVLRSLDRELADIAADLPPAHPEVEPEKPACPAAFAGVPEDAVVDKAQKDAREFDRLTARKHQPAVLWLIWTILCAAGAAVLGYFQKWTLMAVAAALFCIFLAVCLRSRKQNRLREADLDSAEALLRLYENRSRDEFVSYAADYRETLLNYYHICDKIAADRAELAAWQQDQETRTARVLGSVTMFAPGVQDAQSAARAIAAGRERWRAAHQAEERRQTAQLRYEAVAAAVSGVEPLPVPPGDWSGYTMPAVEQELSQIGYALSDICTKLALSRGRVEGFGDSAALQAEKESLEESILRLRQRYAALELAEQTLDAAGSRMQERFAPQLSKQTGEIFAQLTGDRYERVLLDRSMELQAGQTGEVVTRPMLYLSGGTMDALYFALRLAICRQALDRETPIVLDDALVMFDDTRLRRALALLKAEAQTRQVLLFTCQSREREILEGGNAE